MTYQNITVVSSWRSILQTPDSSSDNTLSGFQLSDKKNNLESITIPNQSQNNQRPNQVLLCH